MRRASVRCAVPTVLIADDESPAARGRLEALLDLGPVACIVGLAGGRDVGLQTATDSVRIR